MKQKKWLKAGFVAAGLMLTGLLYSCREREEDTSLSIINLGETQDSGNTENVTVTGNSEGVSDKEFTEEFKGSEEIKETIYVHLCGEVKNPDVYRVETGTRLTDVIKLAGGLTEEAAGDFVNQAALVTDGQQIYVPAKHEVEDKIPADYQEILEQPEGKVNLNTADVSQLMTLPGVGQAKAESIISYRQEHGDFKAIEDIMKISGIKDSVFNKIKDKIMVK